MTARAKHLRRYFIVALLMFISGTLALTTYTLLRLRSDAILNGLKISAMHSRSFEDFITQNLLVTELVGANLLEQEGHATDVDRATNTLLLPLRHTPFLRSLSVLDDRGRIIASSNMANLGKTVPLEDYLPPATKTLDIFRIGRPWSGRDFADGHLGAGDANSASFIPIVRTLKSGERTLTLLVALNPDYFINHMVQKIDIMEGTVEVVRYDGMLLMNTNQGEQQGDLSEYMISELLLNGVETGEIEQTVRENLHELTAFRASRLYPFVVVTHINRDYALRHWRDEAKTLLGIVIPSVLAVVVLAAVFYRRQQQLFAQRAENQRLEHINATVFDSSNEATLITDLNANIVSVNSAFTCVTGYRLDEVLGRPLVDFLAIDEIPSVPDNMSSGTEPGKELPESPAVEVQQRCKDGSLIWTEILSTPERNEEGTIIGYYRISRNITERKRMEDKVRQLAFHDHLTNLPNRRLLKEHMKIAMAANMRSGHHSAILFLDLDNFKQLNDKHGHDVGDLLLIEMADRLKNNVREMDTVARFGGDEFVVLGTELDADKSKALAQVGLIAEKIRLAISEPCILTIRYEEKRQCIIEHQCTSSIGVALFSNHERQDQILKWADDAMYQAKGAGNNMVWFHDLKTNTIRNIRTDVSCVGKC